MSAATLPPPPLPGSLGGTCNLAQAYTAPPEVTALLMDSRTLRPFKSSEEYLYAMKEDLAEWMNALYPELGISVDLFMDRLEDGIALCKHSNNVRKAASEHAQRRLTRSMSRGAGQLLETKWPAMGPKDVQYRSNVKPGTFLARDNVSNFITWCKHDLGVHECLLFETDDLILRKNEKHVVLCLMEVARRGAKFGVPAPMLVQFEREIDREIAREQREQRERGGSQCEGAQGVGEAEAVEEEDEEEEEDYPLQYGPVPQIVTNDLKSLDEMVRDLVERCTCPTQFPMIRVSEGKYRIGDTKVLIFVRILRKHVMVRVGGGWDTLSHYLDKHDPCRCRAGHRTLMASRLVTKSGNNVDLNTAQVHYDRTPSSPPRTRRSSTSSVGSGHNVAPASNLMTPASPARGARQRSRSPRAVGPRQRSRSPRPPSQTPQVTHTNASDSGSEVSDEGYRSLGNKLQLPGVCVHDEEAEIIERPESAMTHSSDCSSSTPDEAIPPPRRHPNSRRSASPCVRKDTPDSPSRRLTPNSRNTPMPRSRSVSGEPSSHHGNNNLKTNNSQNLSRNGVGYRSVRTKSSVTPPTSQQQNTWNSPRSNKSRPSINQDTFQSPHPFGPPSTRRSLPSREPSSTHSTPTRKPSKNQNKQQQQALNSLPTSPSKNMSPILQQILATSENTQDDAAFLQNLRAIITQYETKVQPNIDSEALTREWVEEHGINIKPTPRRSSQPSNDTRIPVPTFYKQTSKGSLIDASAGDVSSNETSDVTCCL